MTINKLNRRIFLSVIIAPSLIYELYNFRIVSNPWLSILGVIGTICIIINFMVAFIQLTVSYDWLYSKFNGISIKPLFLLYKDKESQRYTFNPSYRERVVHTLIGFAFYLLAFTNLYQYTSWAEFAQSIQSFNISDLSFFNAFYFTSVTAATVGYGDIYPCSTLAKILVTIQIWTTFIYVIGILTSLPNIFSKIGEK